MAGNILLSNESIDDNEFDLLGGIGDAIARGMGTKVDDGVLYGDGVAPHPNGVYDSLTNVTAPPFEKPPSPGPPR
jgi:HK97 family phage major capsid protein